MEVTILKKIEEKLSQGERGALVTVTGATGSTPRKSGTIMGVFKDELVGTIGGGKIESVVIDRARQLLETGESENFEYKAAKQAQNRNRSRIRYLERMIKSAHVIEDKAGADEVGLFDKVELLFEDDDDTDTIQVVTTVRCDPLNGRISCKAPLGKAVLGKKVGDQVDVTTEEGDSYTVVIKSITKEKDDGSGPIL